MTDRRRKAVTAALAVALLAAAGCASLAPAPQGDASGRAADSQVRDTPLVAVSSVTMPRPPVRVPPSRSGSDRIFPIVSPGRLPPPQAAVAWIRALASPEWAPDALVLIPGSPRGPPPT